MTLPVMEITLVKAAGPGDRDRTYLDVDGTTRRGPGRAGRRQAGIQAAGLTGRRSARRVPVLR